MGNAFAIAAILGAASAFSVDGLLAAAALIGALVLAICAVFTGARGALALAALSAAAVSFTMHPAGLGALVTAFGENPRRFDRQWGFVVEIVSTAAIAVAFAVALRHRGPTPFVAALETADDFNRLVGGIGRLAAWLFVPMILIIVYDITQRKIIDIDSSFVDSILYFSSTKLQELEWHLHGALFLLVLGLTYIADAHVRIELVRDRLRPRMRIWLEFWGALLFLLPYCFVIVKFGVDFTERAWATNEVSSAQTGLTQRWIIKATLPAGFVLLAMAGLASLLKSVVYLFGPPDLRARANTYAGEQWPDLELDDRDGGTLRRPAAGETVARERAS